MPPVLYLIDGHALAYRTYFALTMGGAERLQTRSGEPTAGVFGFASVLLRILEQDRPEYLAVAFDTGKTFRNDVFPDYKATRAKMPDDLRPQVERIRQMVDAFHIPRLEKEGAEADDVLGTVAIQAAARGLAVKIITGDRDLLQLVTERIWVNLAGSRLAEARDFKPEDVVASLGIRPEQVVDYKALVGDQSDNIPGVPGVGEKTAISLLAQFQTLDDIYNHLDEVPARVRTRLESGRESAYMSRDLAQIRTDISISLDLEQANTAHLDLAAAEKIFQELEFRTLVGRLHKLQPARQEPLQQLSLFGEEIRRVGHAAQAGDLVTHIVQTRDELAQLADLLKHASQIALDTETTSTDPMLAELVGISLAVAPGDGYYIPIGHQTGKSQLPLQEVVSALSGPLMDPAIEKVGHNLKYDVIVLARHGLNVTPLSFDTMIAEWLIDPASHSLGLKDMAYDYLGISMTHIEDLIGKGKSQVSMAEISIDRAAPYAAADAEVPIRLRPLLEARLEEHHALSLMREMEMPLIPVLVDMERNGVALNVSLLESMSVDLQKRMDEIERDIQREVGYSFNLNSTQQLSKVLFETLKLEPPDRRKKTASGHYSTSAGVLEELRGEHPVVDLILEYREISKLRSTYLEALPRQVNPATKRVHTSYNQTGSVTGRLASSNPNLQNIPTRTEQGRQVRCAFVAAPGNYLLSVDYSQIELRIVAVMAEDEAMLAAFQQGQDIHAATAAAIYNVPLAEVTREQRRHAKAINFGLIYGMSAFGLSRSTGLTLGEAETFVKAYFRQFPGVKRYLDGIRKQAMDRGYVETMLGRRRYFPNLRTSMDANLRQREEREAINAPIQGTAADILKLAMIRLPDAIHQAGLDAMLLLQVHDELVLEMPRNQLLETAKIVQRVMEEAYPLAIPLLTDARWGVNWGEMQPISAFVEGKNL